MKHVMLVPCFYGQPVPFAMCEGLAVRSLLGDCHLTNASKRVGPVLRFKSLLQLKIC
jgi:hypothetical protein